MIWALGCQSCGRKFRTGSLSAPCRACGGKVAGLTLILATDVYADDEFPYVEPVRRAAPAPDAEPTPARDRSNAGARTADDLRRAIGAELIRDKYEEIRRLEQPWYVRLLRRARR